MKPNFLKNCVPQALLLEEPGVGYRKLHEKLKTEDNFKEISLKKVPPNPAVGFVVEGSESTSQFRQKKAQPMEDGKPESDGKMVQNEGDCCKIPDVQIMGAENW